jgi:Mor family transcriptional regulator
MAGKSPLTQNGNLNGSGQFYFPDGSYLQACSRNNQLIGPARYIKPNGNYFQGQI